MLFGVRGIQLNKKSKGDEVRWCPWDWTPMVNPSANGFRLLNQYATKRHVHECRNNLQIHGTYLTDFTFITAIKACQKQYDAVRTIMPKM